MLALIASVLVTGVALTWTGRGYVDGEVRAHAAQPAAHPGGASAELVAETRRDVAALRDTVARVDRTVSGIAATLAAMDDETRRTSRVAERTRERPASRRPGAARDAASATP